MKRRSFEIHTFYPNKKSVVTWVNYNRLALKFYLNNCCEKGQRYIVYAVDDLTGQKTFFKSGYAPNPRAPVSR